METVYVYAFPFAAGSRYSFTPLIHEAPDWLKWIPVDYPGRGRRLFEPPLTSLTAIVQDMKAKLMVQPKAPFAFYGHSMGSLVAYLLTVDLVNAHGPLPVHVFLSGRGGACIPERQRHALQLTRKELIQEVLDMDGDLTQLLRNPKQFDQYEQVMRADIAALDGYDYTAVASTPLPVPATVFIGSHDIHTTEQAQLWQRDFQDPIRVHTLEGNHFFIVPQAAQITRIMAETLQASLQPAV